jgi:hypothetical protein
MLSFEKILSLFEGVIFLTEGLKGINSIQKNLNDAILFEFAGTDNFGTKKQGKKGEGFVRNFKSEESKHWFNGLDREIVYARDWAMNVVPDPDGFSSVPLGRGAPFGVI